MRAPTPQGKRNTKVTMENKAAAKKKNSFTHRVAQIFLGSYCTTNTTSNNSNYSAFKLAVPKPQEPPEVNSDCGTDKLQQKQRRRCKLDRSVDAYWFAPQVPMIQVSIDCGVRHSIHSHEPFLTSTPMVEKSDESKEKRATSTALYEAIRKEQTRLPPTVLSACSRNISSYYSYKGGRVGEEAKNKKKMSNQKREKAKRKETMRLLSNAYGFGSSSSSGDSDVERVFYSSDDEDDEEESAGTLFSSRSFSSDSSEFYRSKRKNSTSNDKKKESRSTSMKCTRRPARSLNTRRAPRRHKDYSDTSDRFHPLASYSSSSMQKGETKAVTKAEPVEADAVTEAQKAKGAEGFAMVKSSSDPYMDFLISMEEMIVERGIKTTKDMEGLLHSYLCMNSPHHHLVILKAFKDIWEAIFCSLD